MEFYSNQRADGSTYTTDSLCNHILMSGDDDSDWGWILLMAIILVLCVGFVFLMGVIASA